MLKINVLIKDLPNSQSPKILCHYKKKDLFRYDFSRKTLETLYNVNHSIWLQGFHRTLLVRCDDIDIVLRMYAKKKMQEIHEKSLFDLDYFDIVFLPYI